MSELLLCKDITTNSLPTISCEEEDHKKSITPNSKQGDDQKSKHQSNVVSEEITSEKNPENKCYCYLCEFETNITSTLEKHYETEHKTICCDRCKYIACDENVMRRHKMKHTSNTVHQCPNCEFEATRQALLNDHIESKLKEKEKLTFHCIKCEKIFEYRFLLEIICALDARNVSTLPHPHRA